MNPSATSAIIAFNPLFEILTLRMTAVCVDSVAEGTGPLFIDRFRTVAAKLLEILAWVFKPGETLLVAEGFDHRAVVVAAPGLHHLSDLSRFSDAFSEGQTGGLAVNGVLMRSLGVALVVSCHILFVGGCGGCERGHLCGESVILLSFEHFEVDFRLHVGFGAQRLAKIGLEEGASKI